MKEGTIIKGIGGFYYIYREGDVYRAKGRGAIKNKGMTLMVGDRVEFEPAVLAEGREGDGTVERILKRRNSFIRPPIANVDVFIIVSALAKPKINYQLVDKFIIMAIKNNAMPVLCFNKKDLVTEEEIDEVKAVYGGENPTIFLSGKSLSCEDISILKGYIKGRTVAFAGPSGVGKSTLINALLPKADIKTGDISRKTQRGKHTTRHVEIFPVENGGMIVDTPGFTSFDILEAEEDALDEYYPDIIKYKGQCRFDNCKHHKEPECAVVEAVNRGDIHPLRYKSYIDNLEEIRKKRKKNHV